MILPFKEIDLNLANKLKAYVFDIIGCSIAVRKEMGPWLNEYVYQDALEIALNEKDIPFIREYRFHTAFHGHTLGHHHQVDFFVKNKVFIECKAVSALTTDHRQQLWNYMRLTNIHIGILYNFAPTRDQCEKYFYDTDSGTMSLF